MQVTGVTTVQDGMVAKPLFQLLKYASGAGLLKLDVVGYADVMTASDCRRRSRNMRDSIKIILKWAALKCSWMVLRREELRG